MAAGVARILGLSNVIETGRIDSDERIVVEAEALEPVFPEHSCANPDWVPRLVRDGYRSGKRREISDTPHAGRPVTIAYRQARARCRTCGRRGLDELVPHLHAHRLMTVRLHALIGLEAVRDTHAGVSRRFGVSEKTVAEVFKETTHDVLRSQILFPPWVLGIDFTKLAQHRRIAVIANLDSRMVIDVVDDGMRGLKKFLRSYRDLPQVRIICTDLEAGWIGLHRQFFPHARHIVDKWHVMARAGHAVDNMVWAAARRAAPERKYGYRVRVLRLLRYRPSSEAMQNGGLAQLEMLGRSDPSLVAAYWAKERFFRMYDECFSAAEAEAYHTNWRRTLPSEVAPTFERMCVFGPDWEPALFAYFAKPYNNAYVESINASIKELHRSGRGYSFDVMRAKVRLTPSTAPWVTGYPFDGALDFDHSGNIVLPWWMQPNRDDLFEVGPEDVDE